MSHERTNRFTHTPKGAAMSNQSSNRRINSLRQVCRTFRAAEPLEPRRLFNVFTVTSSSDTGPGSLHEAITQSNDTPGKDTIAFKLPGSGTTIRLSSSLPAITD